MFSCFPRYLVADGAFVTVALGMAEGEALLLLDFDDYVQIDSRVRYWWIDHKGYARVHVDGKMRLVHRLVAGVDDPAVFVDHKSGVRLDCRKENLRPVDIYQSNQNRQGPFRHGKSGVRNVYFDKSCRSKPWTAAVQAFEKVHKKRFETKDEAEAWALEARGRLHCVPSETNFAHGATEVGA